MTEPIHVSHDVELFTTGTPLELRLAANKEEVNLTFVTTWRGATVNVRMEARRYRGDSTWTDWQIYADKAREGEDPFSFGKELTDTARMRLSEQLRPVVVTWLASKAYAASRRRAFAHALAGLAREMKPYGDSPSRDLRQAIEVNRAELLTVTAERLTAAADAFDEFTRMLDGIAE